MSVSVFVISFFLFPFKERDMNEMNNEQKTVITVTAPAAIVPQTYEMASTSYGAAASPKVTFQPVSDDIITQIMGYVSLGLPALNVDRSKTASSIYRWHTWISRMNEWMKQNVNVYPKFMELPPVQVPASLHFLETIKGDSLKTANAATAPLGPLFPIEKNTLIHALRKGVENSSPNYEHGANDVKTFSRLIHDMDRLATFAIQPQNRSVSNSMTILPDDVVPKQRIVSDVILPVPALGRIGNVVENFKRGPFRRMENVPFWMWVMALMVIIYFFNKSGEDGFPSSSSYFEPSATTLTGGTSQIDKILSISDFTLP